MPKYLVDFAFRFADDSLRPDDKKHGTGSIPITTDKEPETEEEFKEIARTIGKQGGYVQVAITHISDMNVYIDDSGETLEGTIVNDK